MMSRESVIALIGAGVIACTTTADPFVVRTAGDTAGELGMYEGWSMALTTETPAVGVIEDAFTVFHDGSSDATAATVELSGTTLTLIITDGDNAGTYPFNLTAAAYDTLTELVDEINDLENGFVANLVGDGDAASSTLRPVGGVIEDAFTVFHDESSGATAATVELTGDTLTLIITDGDNAGTSSFDLTDAAFDTLTELVDGVNDLANGFVANLVGDGDAASSTLQSIVMISCFGPANTQTAEYIPTVSCFGQASMQTVEYMNLAETVHFTSSPGFRLLEYDPEQDLVVQPVPEACYEDHPRIVNMLGPWPEGTVSAWLRDGADVTEIELPANLTGQLGFGSPWGTSLAASPDGRFLAVGSATAPAIGGMYPIGMDCNIDVELLPGGFKPRGYLDLYHFDMTGTGTYDYIGWLSGPLGGQPTALCTCIDDVAMPTIQTGLGFSTDVITFQDGLTEKVLIISGMPWFDGNGAYPVFTAVDIPDEGTIVYPGEDAEGLCCTGTSDEGVLTSIECAMLGGVLINDPDGLIMAAGGCLMPWACCVNDGCAGDMIIYDCFMAMGNPSPGGSCLAEDEPCPNDAITLALIPEGQGSDPTACGRGGAYAIVYDPSNGSVVPVSEAIDINGDPMLEYPPWDPNTGIIGTLGLVPDPLAVDAETPAPNQLMGYDVAATQSDDGTIWLAIGAPFAGGVSGVEGYGVEPDCSQYYGDDLLIGPMNGRVVIYTLDPDTMTITHHQTLVASDGNNFHGFGSSLDFDGENLVVGAPEWYSATSTGGAVYTFALHDWGFWVQTDRLHATDDTNGARFGYDVSLYGDKLAVGAPLQDTDADGSMSGAIHRFNFDPDLQDWTETELLLPPQLGDAVSPNPGNQQFGRSVVISDTAVFGGGPQLVTAITNPFTGQLMLTTTGGTGFTESRPLPNPVAAACEGDLDGNDEVNVRDLIHMLRGMSSPLLYPECDVNDDDVVDAVDLIKVINNWGPCE